MSSSESCLVTDTIVLIVHQVARIDIKSQIDHFHWQASFGSNQGQIALIAKGKFIEFVTFVEERLLIYSLYTRKQYIEKEIDSFLDHELSKTNEDFFIEKFLCISY